MRATLKALRTDAAGNVYLILLCPEKYAAKKLYETLKDGEIEFTATPYYAKRTNKANNYFWKLIGLLSQKVRVSKDEIYLNLLHDYGVFNARQIPAEDIKAAKAEWERQGTGYVFEVADITDGTATVLEYIGTSAYNASQFDAILGGLKQDCESVGIEVEPNE